MIPVPVKLGVPLNDVALFAVPTYPTFVETTVVAFRLPETSKVVLGKVLPIPTLVLVRSTLTTLATSADNLVFL
jgi:hypothetical protein